MYTTENPIIRCFLKFRWKFGGWKSTVIYINTSEQWKLDVGEHAFAIQF